MSISTQFILNDQDIQTNFHPGILILDFLRQNEKLMGTKEGCREGDCGACTVIIGELANGKVTYKPVTSCLMPLGELHGKHLVTIEGLNLPELSPVQEAIVEEGATQCGFCTPGIVVSLTASLMEKGSEISRDSVMRALSGHLCRCTGYRSLIASETHLLNAVDNATGTDALLEKGFLPGYFRKIAERLNKIPSSSKPDGVVEDFLIAGGTDLYIQENKAIPDSPVTILNLRQELKEITRKNGYISVGALTSFEEFASHSDILEIIPEIEEYMFLIASWQIRNRATIGGNIINASPIGDMTILLLAMNAHLVLQNGIGTRTVPLTSFYKGYKQLDKTNSEVLTEILIPVPAKKTRIHFDKVSKRKCLDIASVNLAVRVEEEDGFIEEVGLAAGGIAPIPLHLKKTCSFLKGQIVSREIMEDAIAVMQEEISPITDIRGSREYKRLLARQLVIKSFIRLFPKRLSAEEFYEKY
ncbi:MAG: FAD binding domain-containing protein [Candidatus Marinimicrobia bacterium]|nr:FAD binding domain-containing protein [Candidatus Neomarinimicrobiota bacterium]